MQSAAQRACDLIEPLSHKTSAAAKVPATRSTVTCRCEQTPTSPIASARTHSTDSTATESSRFERAAKALHRRSAVARPSQATLALHVGQGAGGIDEPLDDRCTAA